MFFLVVHEVRNCLDDGGVAAIRSGEQSDQTTSSLRGRAWALPFRFRHLITPQRLSEAAVAVLHRAKPNHSPLAVLARGQRSRFQRAQNAAGSVIVNYTPAA